MHAHDNLSTGSSGKSKQTLQPIRPEISPTTLGLPHPGPAFTEPRLRTTDTAPAPLAGSRVASQGRQIAAFKTQVPAYVSESVYQQHSLVARRPRPSFNVTNGLLVRKHSTLHDQANQAHKLPTLTLYVHWHYISKRDNPYHLPLLQIPNQNCACQ